MTPFLLLAFIVFFATLYGVVEIFLGGRKMGYLQDVSFFKELSAPRVSLIVPACNEEKTIKPAIESFLQQEYPNLEILVINDRSTDGTGEVLEELQGRYPQLRVHEITELPKGWLGKAHALNFGAERATGEYLVFTDADILMEKTTISRAASHVVAQQLDHLCLVFKNIASGWLLNGLILDAGVGLFLLFKPWKAKKRKSRSFMGVGAFNMVRKNAYKAIGGHAAFKMHPIDDIMLGKKLKRKGLRQDCLLAYDFVSVRWYETVGGMIEGLMKNVFAIINFRLLYLPGLLFTITVAGILPLWGIVFAKGWVCLLFSLTVMLRILLLYAGAQSLNIPISTVFGALIAPHITLYIVLRAVYFTLKNGGITWRGTHYPLAELKKNEPILF